MGSSRCLHIRFTQFLSAGRARALQCKGLRAIHRLLFTRAMGVLVQLAVMPALPYGCRMATGSP
jgi:hypothetical protein